MLRIVVNEGSAETTLHLEGQIIGPWVDELRRVCDSILSAGGKVSLDLSRVSFVGRDGVRCLWRLRDERVSLQNCTSFVAEQLKALTGSAT